jgi:aconitase A
MPWALIWWATAARPVSATQAPPGPIASAVEENDLVVGAVLSGNRNFEGRVSPHTKANYLASPPLVVAYAIAGNLAIDLKTDPIGQDQDGRPVYLKDIWPSTQEIKEVMAAALTPDMFRSRYSNVFTGTDAWHRSTPWTAKPTPGRTTAPMCKILLSSRAWQPASMAVALSRCQGSPSAGTAGRQHHH